MDRLRHRARPARQLVTARPHHPRRPPTRTTGGVTALSPGARRGFVRSAIPGSARACKTLEPTARHRNSTRDDAFEQPFVVRSDSTARRGEQGGRSGNVQTTSVGAHLLVQPLERVSRPDPFSRVTGRSVKASRCPSASRTSIDGGNCRPSRPAATIESSGGVPGIRSCEDGADGGDDHLAVALRDSGQDIAPAVHLAELPSAPTGTAWSRPRGGRRRRRRRS